MRETIRHFLSIRDLSPNELKHILQRSQFYKKKRFRSPKPLHNQTLGLLFQKTSTRTRVSFEVGIGELGGTSLFLDQHSTQMERGETLIDTLRVMERYFHGLIIRNHDHLALTEATTNIGMPIFNGLSQAHHPTQVIADALTIIENKHRWKQSPRIAYLGEGNNIALSLIEICSRLQWPLTIASPKPYACPPNFLKNAIFD